MKSLLEVIDTIIYLAGPLSLALYPLVCPYPLQIIKVVRNAATTKSENSGIRG